MNSSSEDPQRLLADDGQWTEPWGASNHSAHCDKCGGEGHVVHECWSCLLAGADPACPACAGRMRWDAACPVCRGSGQIDGRPRRGVSVFPGLEGLYRYMLVKEADLDRCVVLELDAHRAEDVDFDADLGALLAIPSAIVACRTVDHALADSVAARAERLADCVLRVDSCTRR